MQIAGSIFSTLQLYNRMKYSVMFGMVLVFERRQRKVAFIHMQRIWH